jgi:predicted ATP-grasp superfamily ATP-dependent carboligase
VDQDRWGPARFSRHSAGVYRSPSYDSDNFCPWLLDLAERERLEGWPIIATDDEQVRQLGLNIDEIQKRFRYIGPTWTEFEKLYDKRLCYEWCLAKNIPAPLSYLPKSREDLPQGQLEYPFIVKPAFKRNFKHFSKAKAVLVRSEAELRGLLAGRFARLDIHDLLFQELIPGEGRQQWSYAGFFVDGKPVATFTACRLRQHPPDFGRASTYVIAQHDPEVEVESLSVMAALNYTGLAEVEWKRDPRNGSLRFLEVNARCWGWHSLAAAVVGNIPKMFYDYACGASPSPVAARYGARWVKHITDLPVVLNMWWNGAISLREYRETFGRNVTCCEWERNDPLPMFFQIFLIPYLTSKRGY